MKTNQFEFTRRCEHQNISILSATMSDFTYARHSHEEYSLGVTLKGRQDFFCRDRFYKSSPGRVMIFNPEDVHDGHSGGEQSLEYVMLYIHPNQLCPWFKCLGYKETRLRIKDTVLVDPLLRNQILTFAQSIKTNQLSSLEFESAQLYLARLLISHQGNIDPIRLPSRIDTLVTKAKGYILENLNNDLSIDQIAESVNLSKFHFIRMFREQLGITPHQYILNCRINTAGKALERGMNVTQAALDSGFSDASHLNRNFKKVFGITPKQFQSQCRR